MTSPGTLGYREGRHEEGARTGVIWMLEARGELYPFKNVVRN